MAEASIPVDLFNPGQVFACLGFLEAADVLCGDAAGGFDWSNPIDVRFRMRAKGEANPFEEVLKFLAESKIQQRAPIDYLDPSTGSAAKVDDDSGENLVLSESFPCRKANRMALPIQLESRGHPPVVLRHWTDGSSRNDFKLYAGNRSAFSIATLMLRGKQQETSVKSLRLQQQDELARRPFDVLGPIGGSFNFDPRGGWTRIDAGYSPNDQAHSVAASPVVEMLAVWGLENARPDEYERRRVRYGAWSGLIPLILARPAVAGANIGVALRRFQFELRLSGKNKVVTFAREENNDQ